MRGAGVGNALRMHGFCGAAAACSARVCARRPRNRGHRRRARRGGRRCVEPVRRSGEYDQSGDCKENRGPAAFCGRADADDPDAGRFRLHRGRQHPAEEGIGSQKPRADGRAHAECAAFEHPSELISRRPNITARRCSTRRRREARRWQRCCSRRCAHAWTRRITGAKSLRQSVYLMDKSLLHGRSGRVRLFIERAGS